MRGCIIAMLLTKYRLEILSNFVQSLLYRSASPSLKLTIVTNFELPLTTQQLIIWAEKDTYRTTYHIYPSCLNKGSAHECLAPDPNTSDNARNLLHNGPDRNLLSERVIALTGPVIILKGASILEDTLKSISLPKAQTWTRDLFVVMRPRGMFDQYCEKGRLKLFTRGFVVSYVSSGH